MEEEEEDHGGREEPGQKVIPHPAHLPALEEPGQGQDQAQLGQLQGLELQGTQHKPGLGPVDLPAEGQDGHQKEKGKGVKGVGEGEDGAAGKELNPHGQEEAQEEGHKLAVQEARVGGGASEVKQT